jgi:hypothetical protein
MIARNPPESFFLPCIVATAGAILSAFFFPSAPPPGFVI